MMWTICRQQSGFIASYILYGIGLLAIVGAAYGRLNSSSQQGELVQKTVDDISVQLEVIKGKVLLCGAVYSDGNHGQFNARHAYPAPAAPTHQSPVSQVACPTQSGPLPLSQVGDGVPTPVSPPDFNEWVYEHTLANGIRLRLAPKHAGGANNVRARLLRQFQGSVSQDGDQLVFEILK